MRPFLLLVLTALAMAVSAPLGAQQGRDLLAWEEPLRALSEQVFLKEAVGDVVVYEAGDISGTLLGLDRDGPGGGRPRVRARVTSGSQWISWQAHPTSGPAVKTFGIRLAVDHGGSTPDPDPDPPPPTSGCVPTTTALQFDGGYKVSMCYRTPAGEEGQAKAGVWASGQSGILWFFDRGNAEVLVKVLDGCANNGHRWVFVAPVTTLEFNLWVTGPNGDRWPLSNQQGVTAATKSDTSAFKCADENGGEGDGDGDDDDGDAAAPDLVVSTPSVNNSSPSAGGSFTLRATVRNQGDAPSATTTLRYYRSSNSSITSSDTRVGTDAVGALAASGTSAESISLTAPSSAGTYYYGACVGSVSGESDMTNNCSTGVRVVVGGGGSDAGNSVRLMYVSPANREFRADYSASMASAIVDAQDWYRGQMDGLTFSIDSLVPEWCRLPRNDDYYARGHAWEKVLEDVQSCAPVGYNSRFSWVLYVDVEERCDEQQELGAGGPGLIMVPRADLEGLTNPGIYYHCDEGPYNGPLGRWIGGLAHELGHSFGLPHPPGCDDGLSTCDEDALLWNGYQSYPDTYLREDEKAVLRRSPFFVTD